MSWWKPPDTEGTRIVAARDGKIFFLLSVFGTDLLVGGCGLRRMSFSTSKMGQFRSQKCVPKTSEPQSSFFEVETVPFLETQSDHFLESKGGTGIAVCP